MYDIHDYVDTGKYGLKCFDMYVGSPALADDVMLSSPTIYGLVLKHNYSKVWRFKFSCRKSKCMIFGE